MNATEKHGFLTARCANCNKPRGDHRSTDAACPEGRKHPVHGYPFYNAGLRFAARTSR